MRAVVGADDANRAQKQKLNQRACGYTLSTQRTPTQSQSIKFVSYTNMKNDQRRYHLSLVVCSVSNLLYHWEFVKFIFTFFILRMEFADKSY